MATNDNTKNRLATTKEVMTYLGISRAFLSKEMASGRLKAYQIGNSYKFRWNDVEEYVNASLKRTGEKYETKNIW